MSAKTEISVSGPLVGSLRDYQNLRGNGLLERTHGFTDWQAERRATGTWPFGRATQAGPKRHVEVLGSDGHESTGVNFASQDYLSLSQHPEICAAAHEAIDRFGVHSAGSPALVGNTSSSLALEERLADFLQVEGISLFPTGWAAGYGVIKGLVRRHDHIVIDALAHACLMEGANSATKNVHLFRHNRLDLVERKLADIRAKDTANSILLVTEGLFSMDSDTPDIVRMQELANEYDATLLVDIAHDFGSLGQNGGGSLELQSMLGKVDLVMGSFSKTFASNGGFVACRDPKIREYLRYYSSPNTFSNALSPIQTSIVCKAIDIVRSEEGRFLRQKNARNAIELRSFLKMSGHEVYGTASPIVCVKMGTERLARLAARSLPSYGVVANLVEYPAVPRGQARFRLQVMALHDSEDIISGVRRISLAIDEAREMEQLGAAPTETKRVGLNMPDEAVGAGLFLRRQAG